MSVGDPRAGAAPQELEALCWEFEIMLECLDPMGFRAEQLPPGGAGALRRVADRVSPATAGGLREGDRLVALTLARDMGNAMNQGIACAKSTMINLHTKVSKVGARANNTHDADGHADAPGREILDNFAVPRAQILATFAYLERAKVAACAEIDLLREHRARLLLEAPDSAINVVDQALAAATRRLERIEAQQAALYERLARPLLAGDPL